MGSKKRPSRSAMVALAAEIAEDVSLSLEVRSRLSWAIRRELEDNRGMSILEEETLAAIWRLLWSMQGSGKDTLTRARSLSELVRAIGGLDRLRRSGAIGRRVGRMRTWTGDRARVRPPSRPVVE